MPVLSKTQPQAVYNPFMKLFSKATLQHYIQPSQVKNLGNSALYFGNSIVQMVIGIVTAPIFARYLLPNDFAIIGYFTAFVGFFNPITHLSLYNYFSIKFFKQNETSNKELLFTLFSFLFVWNLIFLPISYLVVNIVFKHTGNSFSAYPYLAMVFGTAFFSLAQGFVQMVFRLRKQAFQYFLLETLLTVVNIFVSLLLVVQFKMGADGRLGGKLIAQGLVFAISLFILWKLMIPRLNKASLIDGLRLVTPLVLGTFVIFSIRNLDKILLERLGDSNEFGYYNIGFNNANYLILMGNALYAAFEPDVIKYVVKEKYRKLAVSIFLVTAILVSITAVYILFSEPITHYLTSGRYTRAYKYANIIAVGGLFLSLNKLLITILLAFKKTKIILILNVITSIFAYFCYKYAIARFTFNGAAYARIIIAFFMIAVSVVTIYLVMKQQKKLATNA